ncbi:MAG: signal recognition particle protein [Ardenticatenales bacterium]|nr:signal recognition particle protein [Ardenticatenales bacterium]MCB9172483.1 signal recognition particle protein [Ardenticatenales bacterium]
MFDDLTDKLQETFQRLGQKGRLTEEDVDIAMRDVKLALLEADVNFKVVRQFVKDVKAKAIGQQITKTLKPAEMVVKIVNEQLIELLGEPGRLNLSSPPTIIMLVGLQGSGKTTTAGKLANWLRNNHKGSRPMMVAADTYRPAAVRQLEVLGEQLQLPVHSEGIEPPPPEIAQRGVEKARANRHNVIIVDTAGRLNIDEQMMQELEEVKARIQPDEILFVADAMTGQVAVEVAQDFNARVGLTGVIFTKVDGDARGGAALSIREVTGVPIKFLGVGEKLDAIEIFHPDRLAGRILGMGDILTLIEKAEAAIDQDEAEALGARLEKGEFDFEDFLRASHQMKRLGPISKLMGMMPGMGDLMRQLEPGQMETQMKITEAIVSSMTRKERRNPKLLNGSRKKRIAAGSGRTVQEVNQLVQNFREMQKMIKQMPAFLQEGMMGGGGGRGGRRGRRGRRGRGDAPELPFDISQFGR